MQVERGEAEERPETVFARVYRELKPEAPLPAVQVVFCPFANANSSVRLKDGELRVRVTDLLDGAPLPVLEALAQLLLAKLFRRRARPEATRPYHEFLQGADACERLRQIRQTRGRKQLQPPAGRHYDLGKMFAALNDQYFAGLLSAPRLGWSPHRSRTRLGHYDPGHHAIVLSRWLDGAKVPEFVVRYVLFHEMLHLCYPVEQQGNRRCVHSAAFRQEEKTFAEYTAAQEMLSKLLKRQDID